MNNEERKALNQLARESMILKILADIRIDLTICDIEGWDKREYIAEIQEKLKIL